MATKFTLKDFEQADSELRAAQSRTHFYFHTLLYAITNIVLVVFNLMLAPTFTWAIFLVVIWGIPLGIHYLVAFRWMQRGNVKWMARVEYLAEEIHRANEIPARKAA
jgi:2TM domain